ncbi:hypothetical protein CC86DRAFT_306399, partial [Ophiobolus disseminans]
KLRESLTPDYTLSFQHFSIGFFAHALLVSRKPFFLDHAGISSSLSSPTWVLRCRSDEAWEIVFEHAFPHYKNPLDRLKSYSTWTCQVHLDPWREVTARELASVYKCRPEYIKPAIDSATGALLLDLAHLFVF